MYSQHITEPGTIEQLHKSGVHFVRCRKKDEGEKRAKSALDSGWQKRPAPLEAVLKHREAGGLLGFVPARSGLLVVDIDEFPDATKDATALVARHGLRDAHTYPLVARRKGQSFRGATRRMGSTH